MLLVAPRVFRAPEGPAVGPGCLVCPWAAARPRAVRAASFARRVVSKPGQALPPPTGTAARPAGPSGALHTSGARSLMLLGASSRSPARPCGPSGVLHARGPWCAVMASPVSASHAVQSSPCVVSCWRQRYKVRHACEKRAKVGHFERAGRVLYRQWPGAVLVGRVLYRQWPGAVLGGGVLRCLGTVRVSSCRPPAAHGRRGQPIKSLQRSLHRQLWGFCSMRNWLPACRRRVTPLMMPFPPFGGGEAATLGGVLAKLQTHWVKTAKNRWFWLNESALWRNRRLQAR